MRLIIPLLFLGFVHLNLSAQKKPHMLESIGQHYAELARLSDRPDPKLAKLDNISFPMREYSSTSLTTEILRPIYLRPQDEDELQQVIQVPANSSAQTQAELAYLFSEIIPEKRDVFLAGAEAARRSREILGIHYPSDNEASRILGWHLLRVWMKNPAFQKDLRAAKEEWKHKKDKF